MVGKEKAAATLTTTTYDSESKGHTAGNESLMRKTPVALRYLDDRKTWSGCSTDQRVTHYDGRRRTPVCLSLAIRQEVIDGDLDLRAGLVHLQAVG